MHAFKPHNTMGEICITSTLEMRRLSTEMFKKKKNLPKVTGLVNRQVFGRSQSPNFTLLIYYLAPSVKRD